MIPFKKREKISDDKVRVVQRFLVHKNELNYHPKKCIKCGFCIPTCPKEARFIPEPDDPNLPGPIETDPNKCFFCGICDYICPTGANELMINEEHKLIICENGALPKLTPIKLKSKTGIEVNKFIEGKITIDPKKCPVDCDLCIKECPMEVIEFSSLKEDRKVKLNRDNCIYCYACLRVCPVEDAIKLIRSRILYSPKDEEEVAEFSNPFSEIYKTLISIEAKAKNLGSLGARKLDKRVRELFKGQV
ncbi:MAG: 4Fe-4S dicluster domain-containing protein [Candidatus Helarchaeota archaeon]